MVTIVDYGSGNLRSVQKSLERMGAEAVITSDPERVAAAAAVILPGVGAFGDAMRALHDRGLVEPILAHLRADRPFLGICMGLQLLFEVGWEGGRHDGLGVFAGDVRRLDVPAGTKVPHMGWNTVSWRATGHPVAESELTDDDWFYFVHSYVARPADESVIAAVTEYGGMFCSAVSQGRLFATQFHPEKSQAAGLRLLRAFLDIC